MSKLQNNKEFIYQRNYNTEDFVVITILDYNNIEGLGLYSLYDDNSIYFNISIIVKAIIYDIVKITSKDEAIEIYNELCSLLSDLKKNEVPLNNKQVCGRPYE
jgi:hypothetical protein